MIRRIFKAASHGAVVLLCLYALALNARKAKMKIPTSPLPKE